MSIIFHTIYTITIVINLEMFSRFHFECSLHLSRLVSNSTFVFHTMMFSGNLKTCRLSPQLPSPLQGIDPFSCAEKLEIPRHLEEHHKHSQPERTDVSSEANSSPQLHSLSYSCYSTAVNSFSIVNNAVVRIKFQGDPSHTHLFRKCFIKCRVGKSTVKPWMAATCDTTHSSSCKNCCYCRSGWCCGDFTQKMCSVVWRSSDLLTQRTSKMSFDGIERHRKTSLTKTKCVGKFWPVHQHYLLVTVRVAENQLELWMDFN